jgi:hypothetical protein
MTRMFLAGLLLSCNVFADLPALPPEDLGAKRSEPKMQQALFASGPSASLVAALYSSKQGNRGVPNRAFVEELYRIFLQLPDSDFAVNPKTDIYSVIASKLGPWRGLVHRKAAAFEAMVVLAGRESSWNWNEGRDLSAGNTSSETEEAGAWQTSFNARHFDAIARQMAMGMSGKDYIKEAKADHEFSARFTWRVLRNTIRHHGPVLRGEILPYIDPARVVKLEAFFKGAK